MDDFFRFATIFQSTLPARGATQRMSKISPIFLFQSMLPARGATFPSMIAIFNRQISIHAPRTGRDPFVATSSTARRHFNPRSPHGERLNGVFTLGNAAIISIHAPRTGSDAMRRGWPPDRGRFQSTLPARGATQSPISPAQHSIFQSTLPARGATHRRGHGARLRGISIHAPRTGSDENPEWLEDGLMISIHAPRTGSDGASPQRPPPSRHFNPRSPHGERLMALVERLKIRLFQSTLPARGATQKVIPSVQVDADFNPRSPHGERHRARRRAVWAKAFQSTLPARGATRDSPRPSLLHKFQSTLPARGATLLLGEQVCGRQISIHAPRTGSDATAAAYLS